MFTAMKYFYMHASPVLLMLPIQGIKLLGMAYYRVNSRIIINWETKQMSGEGTARLMEQGCCLRNVSRSPQGQKLRS